MSAAVPALEEVLAGPGTSLRLDSEQSHALADGAELDRVGAALRDRAALRALAVPRGLRASVVAVHVAEAPGALTLVPESGWPLTTLVRSRPADGGWLTVVRFAAPAPVAAVLAALGRQAVWPDPAGDAGPLLAVGGSGGSGGEVPCLDERVLNPVGFRADADEPVVDLADLGPVGEALVRSLRGTLGVQATLDGPGAVEAVAALALAGVPVTAPDVPPAAARRLGPAVVAALTAPVDLADPLAREEHSLVLRRAAFDTFASAARRGVPRSVSVVLATRRPDMLDHAVSQVARQRGVAELELVLAPHGFEVDPGRVRAALGGVPVQVVPQPATTPFGDVLAAAAEAASGDSVLKMDDDDWYAPDVVADLLRARAYSGAPLVGMPAELHYLAAQDVTVRRGHPSELYTGFVAGGTMLVDRAFLREVGSFRSVRKYVDAQLLAGVAAAGGTVYRTHGLGYVLRRNESGHTWQVDLDYLLDPARVAEVRPGFAPSRLMETSSS